MIAHKYHLKKTAHYDHSDKTAHHDHSDKTALPIVIIPIKLLIMIIQTDRQ